MRYNIGEKVIVMHYVLNGRIGWTNRVYAPWEDTLDRIMMETLTVTEHHKVAWDQDPNGEKKHDGFVLENHLHQKWSNQFPTASYGQISTTADYYFDRKYPDGVDFNELSDEQMATFEDVTVVIDRIDRGIKYFKEAARPDCVAALEKHRQELIDMIKQKCGAVVDYEVIWKDVPDVKRAVLTWPQGE